LTEQVILKVKQDDLTTTWLAPPEVLDWTEARFFSFSQARRAYEHDDIHWHDFLRSRSLDRLSEDYLRSQQVFCYNEDGLVFRRWTVFQCIYAEISNEDGSFLLSGGRWYRIDRDFVSEVDEYYRGIPEVKNLLPIYDDASEPEYNLRVASESEGRMVCLDRELIVYGGGGSRIEFCDLFDGQDMIHVKRYGGSGGLSHHFAQGLVAAETFLLEPEFRSQVNDKLPSTLQLGDPRLKPDPGRYRIVFAIISRSVRPLELPFFARVSLRHVVKRLREGFGFRLALTKVDWNEIRAKRITTQRKAPG
jgi:uncharacterized protein (TIGR04141 family)